MGWAARAGGPAGSILAVALALLVTWHVISGRHGLSVWQQKRVEDKQLRKEIDSLEQENARLRDTQSRSSSPIRTPSSGKPAKNCIMPSPARSSMRFRLTPRPSRVPVRNSQRRA